MFAAIPLSSLPVPLFSKRSYGFSTLFVPYYKNIVSFKANIKYRIQNTMSQKFSKLPLKMDRLTALPGELQIKIVNELGARDLWALKPVNQHFYHTVVKEEPRIKKEIIERETRRFKKELNSVDFRGVPVHIAYRRFTAIYGYHEYPYGCTIPSGFCLEYTIANPDKFTGPQDVERFVAYLSWIDEWLHHHHKQPSETEIEKLDAEIPILGWVEALKDAVGETEAPIRYAKLSHNFNEYLPGRVPFVEFTRMIEDMRKTPLAPPLVTEKVQDYLDR